MTERQEPSRLQSQLAFYMDILSHDVLNNNQAVIGYLELILTEPGFEKKVRRYAEKAIPHIRTSTLLVDNARKVLATRNIDIASLGPVDLMVPVSRAPKELERFFPDRKVSVTVQSDVAEAHALGNSVINDLILDTLVDIVMLDSAKEVAIAVKLVETTREDHECWSLRIENPEAELPTAMRGKDIDAVFHEDSSTTVRMAGMLFSKIVATNLGGDFEAEELRKEGERRGVLFTITLRKAGGK